MQRMTWILPALVLLTASQPTVAEPLEPPFEVGVNPPTSPHVPCLPVYTADDCFTCSFQTVGATVGYSQPLIENLVPGIVTDFTYKAYGTFGKLDPERNPEGLVMFHKYRIDAGFSAVADKCYT